jgi:hypothetical protein
MIRAWWLAGCILAVAILLVPPATAQEPALDSEHTDRECGFSFRYPARWKKAISASDRRVTLESPDPLESSVQITVGPIKDWRISGISVEALVLSVAAQNCLF